MILSHHLARIAIIAASVLGACKTTANHEPRPALLSQTDQSSQDALTLAVSKAVGSKVTLAPDSFMTKSSVTIEPPSINKRNGYIIDGRSREMPVHIDLMMRGKNCFVINRSTGEQYPVKGLACKPLV